MEDELFIGGQPQLNFGGRSIFWSGLIPTLQQWELDFFPPKVREDLVEHPACSNAMSGTCSTAPARR